MAGTGHMRYIQWVDLQKILDGDLNSISKLVLKSLQDSIANLTLDEDGAPRSGFFATGFKIVPKTGTWDLQATAGYGFQVDDTDLGDEDSQLRSLWLGEATDVLFDVSPSEPDDGTYYVHVKWNSGDDNEQSRLVRPGAGSAFEATDVDLYQSPLPLFLINESDSEAGYLTIAKVVKSAADSESDDYSITDLRDLYSAAIGLSDAEGNKATLTPTSLVTGTALQDFLLKSLSGNLTLQGGLEAILYHLTGLTRGISTNTAQQLIETFASAVSGSFKMREKTGAAAPTKVIDFFTREGVDLGGGDVATLVSLLGTCPANGDQIGDDVIIFRLGCEDEGIDFRFWDNSGTLTIDIHKSVAPGSYVWADDGLLRISSDGKITMPGVSVYFSLPLAHFQTGNTISSPAVRSNDFQWYLHAWKLEKDTTAGSAWLYGELPLGQEFSVMTLVPFLELEDLMVDAESDDTDGANGVLQVSAVKVPGIGGLPVVVGPVEIGPGESGAVLDISSLNPLGVNDRLVVSLVAESGHDDSNITVSGVRVKAKRYSLLSR